MLDVPLVSAEDVEGAARVFHRDGFVAVRDGLTPEQLARVREGAFRVIREQTEATPLEQANRGFARYSFGDQTHHPEWAMLVDLPTVLPIVERIWGSDNFTCMGAGGDYSVPGAQVQPLHSDMGEFFHDPTGAVTFHDVPAPFIVVNFPVVDFTEENGAIRFVPSTHRSREPVPTLAQEPEWMRRAQVCAPAGTALIRDVRCWHGGTENRSQQIRPMVSVGYYAPWFRARQEPVMPRSIYDTLSPRAQALCRGLAAG